MKVKNINSASNRTEKLIRDTFADMLYEKHDIEKIEVTELCRRAEIHRSTFYTHYDDIYQVSEALKEEVAQVLFESVQLESIEDIDLYLESIYEYLKDHDTFIRLCFNSSEVTDYVLQLGKALKQTAWETAREDPGLVDKELLELEISLISDGIVMQLIRYYHGELDTSLEEIIACGKMKIRELLLRRSNPNCHTEACK